MMPMHPFARRFLAVQAALLVVPALLLPATASAKCCSCAVESKTLCLLDPPKDDCPGLSAANPDLKGVDCKDMDDAQCKPVAENGRCDGGKTNAIGYKKGSPSSASSSGFTISITAPVLNVPIPGLAFPTDREVALTPGGKIRIPFLSQYIAAVFRYLVGISLAVASVMVVYGGFLYVLGSSFPSISRGKEVIQDALIGTCLLLGAVTILDTINADIIEGMARPLEIFAIQRLEKPLVLIDRKVYLAAVATPGPDGKPGKVEFDTPDCQFPLQTVGKYKDTPTSLSVYECGVKLAAANGIHPCYAVTALNRESGGISNALGHDENAGAVGGVIPPPRAQFLRAEKKYSGATFPRPAGFPDDCNKNTRETCLSLLKANQGLANDDVLDPTKEDWGLDWRYSHGIGAKQVTIFAKSTWCNGSIPSRSTGGKCWTIRDLLLPGPALVGGLELMKGAGATMTPTEASALKVWIAYAGGPGGEPDLRTKMTMDCFKDHPTDPMAARGAAGKGYDK